MCIRRKFEKLSDNIPSCFPKQDSMGASDITLGCPYLVSSLRYKYFPFTKGVKDINISFYRGTLKKIGVFHICPFFVRGH